MDENKRCDFYSDYHKSLTDNLNHISDDLLRAKWFFLATIAAIGTAYMKIIDTNHVEIQSWGYFIVCLIGNVIFWFISEYTLSHAFLFRFIQTRLAKIEGIFDAPGNLKDPSRETNYVKNNHLEIDYIIPDQFVPIYWASFWLILINTAVAIFLTVTTVPELLKTEGSFAWLWRYCLLSLPFIWKLWTYYLYKLDKFFKDSCDLHFVTQKGDDFFRISYHPSMWGLGIGLVIVGFLLYYGILKPVVDTLMLSALIGFFWPVFLGLIIHILRIFLRLDSILRKLKWFSPEVEKKAGDQREIKLTHLGTLICQLYNII